MISDNPLNPPLLVTPELGKVIKAMRVPGAVIDIKHDNRYKDGNVKPVNGVIRGNSNTVTITTLERSK